jgi:hypothetical protein
LPLRPQVSLRTIVMATLVFAISIAFVMNYRRMRIAEAELRRLRVETGYLEASEENQLAMVRIAVDEPLVWQARVRVPKSRRYRVAYSAVWHEATNKPDWFAAHPLPPGESVVTVRVMKDPRDDQWRISTIVRHEGGVGRIGTVLPDEISGVFRGTHDVISGGVGKQTVFCEIGKSFRLFDERYFSGTGLLLYGDRAPDTQMVGIFAELQPDDGPL